MAVARSVFAGLALAIMAGAAALGTGGPAVCGAADLVLDEARRRLYLVNSARNRVEVFSTATRQLLSTVPTDALPLSAAMSRDGQFLYVASFDGTALNVIDLASLEKVRTVSLP